MPFCFKCPRSDETAKFHKETGAVSYQRGRTDFICFPTVDVIKKSHEVGANLLICHEPAFYTGRDDMSLVEGVQLVEKRSGCT